MKHPLFSLRELFCLITAAAVSLALVLSSAWNNDECRLLALTLGGSLLGIAVARVCRQPGGLAGIVVGTAGGAIALAIIAQDWSVHVKNLIAHGATAAQVTEYRNDFLAAGAATLVLAVLLATLSVTCYRLLNWATTAGDNGLLATVRRYPYRLTGIVAAIAAVILSAANIDILLAPQAWRPRHFIPFSEIADSCDSFGHGPDSADLSRGGDWLVINRNSLTISGAGPQLYRLDPHPRLERFSSVPTKRAAYVAFDCDQDRLAFVEAEPTSGPFNIHVVDLSTFSDTVLPETIRHANVHSLQWLHGGSLVINHDKGHTDLRHTKLQQLDGQWSRVESNQEMVFDPRFPYALGFKDDQTRIAMWIIDLHSTCEVASYTQEWFFKAGAGLGSEYRSRLKLSPDGRFIVMGSRIYDLQSQTVRNWRVEDCFPQPSFHGFTRAGHALYDGTPFRSLLFLWHVPIAKRMWEWLARQPVSLIDSTSGLQVACTQPLWSRPKCITLSYDGSRMAVFNNEGVYVYDVPAEFR